MMRCDCLFPSYGRCIRRSCFLPDNSLALYLHAVEEAKGELAIRHEVQYTEIFIRPVRYQHPLSARKVGKGQNVYMRMQESHPSQDVSRMLKRAREMPKSEAVESLDLSGCTISEAAANFCEISYRSYSDKAKRQRRSLQASQGPQRGKDNLSRSISPEPSLEGDLLDKPPLRSRSRLDADGNLPACLTCSRGLLARCARISRHTFLCAYAEAEAHSI